MHIVGLKPEGYLINIMYKSEKTSILFDPAEKELQFLEKNQTADILKKNEYQLRKILHNKRPETFYKGFRLNFTIKNNSRAMDFNDLAKFVVFDKRGPTTKCYVVDEGANKIPEAYIDGCYLEKSHTGAFAVIVKNLKGKLNLFTGAANAKKSTLVELQAAILSLEILENQEMVRIITDSRYVIKGLTEWVEHWKLNNWHTAQGQKVKNIEYWKKFEKLTQNKYIEFKWVKGHAFHFENTLCDFYAKAAAKRLVNN